MGGVFFRRENQSLYECINDYSEEITNLFRIIQRNYEQFLDLFKYQLASRAEFNRQLSVDPRTLTDIERAFRFLYLQRLSFGGNVNLRNFRIESKKKSQFNVDILKNKIEAIHNRLKTVTIQNLNYDEFIEKYDKDYTLFYLDPPYWDCENCYGKGLFDKKDFEKIADILSNIKGKFIMSINNVNEIKDIYKKFNIIEVETSYSVNLNNNKVITELLISNSDRIPSKTIKSPLFN